MARTILLTLPQILLTICVLALGVAHAADPAAGKVAAKVILEKGWEKTAAARDVVNREFAAAELQTPNDPFLLGAHWMALANQGRFGESLKSLDAFLKNYPHSLPALHAKLYVHTVLKDYKKAMDAAEVLAQVVSRDPAPADAAARTKHDDAIDFLGRFAGYLEHPLQDVVNPEQRQKFEDRLLAKLDDPRKALFEKGQQTVATKFDTLEKKADETQQDTQESAATEKQKKIADLAKEEEKIAEAGKKVEEREKKAAEELQRTLDNLNRLLAAAAARITELQNRVTSLDRNLTQAQLAATQIRQQMAREKSSRQQPQLQETESNIQGTQRQIANLNTQIAETQIGYVNIQRQIQNAQVGGAIQGQQLDNQRKGLDQKNKLNERRQKKAEQAKDPSKMNTLHVQARAFSTYTTLPLDELRDDLLAKLR